MEDSISRQDANRLIDEILENDNLQASPTVWHCLHRLKELLTAERRGKWIKMSDRDGIYWACSECGYELPRFMPFDRQFDLFPSLKSTDRTNYCPCCGVKMEK